MSLSQENMNLVEILLSTIIKDPFGDKKWHPNQNLMILVKPVSKLGNLVQLKLWLQPLIETRNYSVP